MNSLHTFLGAVCIIIVFVICFAGIVDTYRARKERVARMLEEDLRLFPKVYRALLKDCGDYTDDDKVREYLRSIIQGYEDSRALLRGGLVAAASRRYEYVKLCFHKARESAAVAADRAQACELLLNVQNSVKK